MMTPSSAAASTSMPPVSSPGPNRASSEGDAVALLGELLGSRLGAAQLAFWEASRRELRAGADANRAATLLALASRHARDRTRLAPEEPDRLRAGRCIEGWNPERWGLLEALRVSMVVAWPALAEDAGAAGTAALEELFRFSDEGEQRALYRSLALLPARERFRERAAEGCRTNILGVFEADVLDTPYPARHFDDVAFNQAVLKSLFLGAPLWRLFGLDERLSPELARMALDYADERRSAGRQVPPELWLTLGPHGGERALASIEQELGSANENTLGRVAAAHALARAGREAHLLDLRGNESDPEVLAAIESALAGARSSSELHFLHA